MAVLCGCSCEEACATVTIDLLLLFFDILFFLKLKMFPLCVYFAGAAFGEGEKHNKHTDCVFFFSAQETKSFKPKEKSVCVFSSQSQRKRLPQPYFILK